MLHYNLQEAINLRGHTVGELGFVGGEPNEVIDFKDSCSIASDGNYLWDAPLHVHVLNFIANMHKVTRDKWREAYSSYRKYMRDTYDDDCEQNY